MLDGQRQWEVASLATVGSARHIHSAIMAARSDPDKNYLTKRRKYPLIGERIFCPQCLHDGLYGLSNDVIETIPLGFFMSRFKSYARNESVRRHLREVHKMGPPENQ